MIELHVAALGGRRLDAQDLLEHGLVVLDQRLSRRTTSCRAATWTMPVRSVRYSILPDLTSSTALPMSNVIVPALGLGILPCGPRMRPSRPTVPIMSGVAMATSKSVQPSCDPGGQVVAADEVGAGLLGLLRLLALGEHGDGHRLAQAVGQEQRAAQLLVGVADVDAEAHVHLDRLVELRVSSDFSRRTASSGAYSFSRSTCWRAVGVRLAGHQASTSTPIERAVPATIFIAASTSFAFRSGILRSAIARSWSRDSVPTLSRFGSPEPDCEVQRLLDQHGGGRRLGDEGERAVLVHRDLDRRDLAGVGPLRRGVERLAELHDVDAVLAQRGADRRGRVRLPGGDLQLDDLDDLLGHRYLLWCKRPPAAAPTIVRDARDSPCRRVAV